MFTMTEIQNGEAFLRNHLLATDHAGYSSAQGTGRVFNHWLGRGGDQLGLRSGKEVALEDFAALARNEHPATGRKLVFPEEPSRVPFFNFEFVAPKSVSLMATLGKEGELISAHDTATKVAFLQWEGLAVARPGNLERERAPKASGNLCAALFLHDRSSTHEPELHTHVVVANTTQVDGKWSNLDGNFMAGALVMAEMNYKQTLAGFVEALGYKTEPAYMGFEISGVLAMPESGRTARLTTIRSRALQESGRDTAEKMDRIFLNLPDPESTKRPQSSELSEKTSNRKVKPSNSMRDAVRRWEDERRNFANLRDMRKPKNME